MGIQESWRGCKLHIDAADGGFPISCLLTLAPLHDSQATVPLSRLSTDRTICLCELTVAEHDSIETGFNLSGHAAVTDVNTRRDTQRKEDLSAL